MYKKLLLTLVLLPTFVGAQHQIKGTFSPAEEYQWAILYRVEPDNLFYTTDTQLAEDGSFALTMDSTVTKGVYRLVYALPQEDYNFDILYNGEEDIELEFNSESGLSYVASKENILLLGYEKDMSLLREELIKNYQKEEVDPDAIEQSFKTLTALQTAFEAEAKGTMVLNFIRANRPYVPAKFEDFKTYVEKYKASYFKYVDFHSPVLQKSGFLLEHSQNFIKGFVNSSKGTEASQIENVDILATQIQNTSDVFQKAFLGNIWQEMVNEERAPVANHLAVNYLIPLANTLGDTKLSDKLTLFKNTSIGSKAPNFAWEEDREGTSKQNSLDGMDTAENYILVFWSSSCSHCLKEVPKLHERLKSFPKGTYQVIAIGLEDEPYDWQNTIYDLPDFTHVLGLGKWENAIGNAYDVGATPTYFVLDKDKKIIAKPEAIGDLLKVLQE